MKRILYFILLFAVTSVVCLLAGYGITRYSYRQEQAVPNTVIETETVNDADEKAAVNQAGISGETEAGAGPDCFFLVEKAGALQVLKEDGQTVYLYTHIPLLDFPHKEQERLLEGIWFSSMMDVYHYLESYTS